jgi:repressor LexA
MTALGYKSPHSAMLVVNRLIDLGVLKRRSSDGQLQIANDVESHDTHARTINIPLVGAAPCGQPLLAEENIEMIITVSTELAKPPHRYFFLRAIGDSMDQKGIQSGDLVLVRQQPDAENGQVVVALIDDEATMKELHKSADAIVLKPRSSNPEHRPIVLNDDFKIQGVVVASVPNLIN